MVLLLVLFAPAVDAAALLAVFVAEGATDSQRVAVADVAARVGAIIGAAPAEPTPSATALRYWSALRAGDDALVAIESAQFAAWRARHQGYRVVAVSKHGLSYSVVARPGITVLDVDDLASLRIAVPAPPSLPALQLLALFADPLRAPRLHHVERFSEGLALLRAGVVDAAVLAEPMSRTLSDVHEVLTLEETPAAVVSVAPDAPASLVRRLREMLRVAPGGGRPPLSAVGGFRPPGDEDASRFVTLLGGTWGATP